MKYHTMIGTPIVIPNLVVKFTPAESPIAEGIAINQIGYKISRRKIIKNPQCLTSQL